MKPSTARTLLSLTLIIGAGVAPFAGVMDSCPSRVQAAQVESCGGCCGSMTKSCCGPPNVARACACSKPTSPPVDPTQHDRSTQRVELRWAPSGPAAVTVLDAEHSSSHFASVVVSPSGPTTRIQAVLCRWLT